jgi:hypothetical protein
MIPHKNVPPLSPPLVLVASDIPQFSDQQKVHRPNGESSSQMNDEGCPNESPSVDDATGYSQEEEEA